jgi:hypothetical protein
MIIIIIIRLHAIANNISSHVDNYLLTLINYNKKERWFLYVYP